MDEEFSERIVGFLSNYFEPVIYITGCVWILFFFIILALKLKDVSIRRLFYSTVRNILLIAIVVGQIILLVLSGYLYWKNYQQPARELDYSWDVSASTQWVKDDVRIYFIDDNALRSIKINNQDSEDVFLGDDPVKEYHFSPDGKYLIVLTQRELFLLDRKTKEKVRVDTLGQLKGGDEGIKGSISGIQWAPDSQKFVYEVARWSKFSMQDSVFVYSVESQKKRVIRSPTRQISSLYWDRQSENLYYLDHEAQDTSLYPVAFEVKVFRISLEALVPELITQIPYEKSSVPVENLSFRGIDLFLSGDRFSFGRSVPEDYLVSEKGSSIGIDEDDYLYFVGNRWFRKRLYKIIREPQVADTPRYQYKGGDLLINHIRWIPGGRYVIMEHRYWGVLIMEPSSGKVGLLIRANGRAFGWYQG